jgi:uncharacterized protein YkwD
MVRSLKWKVSLGTALVAALFASTQIGAEEATVATSTSSETQPAAKPAPKLKPQSTAQRIAIHTNWYRQQAGLPELTINRQLSAAAQQLANHMAMTGSFGHGADGRMPQHRVSAQGYSWSNVNENIAYTTMDAGSRDANAAYFMNQWLNSPGHRAAIYSWQNTEIGVAVARSPWGALYAVQVFARPAGR